MRELLELYEGALPCEKIYAKLQEKAKIKNKGALCVFTGIVRAESNINALSFDIHKPLLAQWFQQWQDKATKQNTIIYMAHSIGDVKCGESSYMCGIFASHRKEALALYEPFIEDFKANAPIWKYDVINQKRVYAKERSHALKGSGILA